MAGRSASTVAVGSRQALPLHRIDVDAYNRIAASGALEGARVELLDAAIVEMSPKSPAHVAVLGELVGHFARAPRWWMQVQDPIEIPPDSEPEPDLIIAAGKPTPGRLLRTALLVVEVAVTSQQVDRGIKAGLYAKAAIPTYWMIDVPARAVEVRTGPGPQGYARCETYREGALLPSPLEGVADLELAALFADVRG